MKLSPPKVGTFVISVIIALIAIIGLSVDIPFVSDNAFWVMVIAYLVLGAGALFKGI